MPGILLAVVVKLTLRDPPRGQTEPGYVHTEQPPLVQSFLRLWRKRSFRHLSFASGLHAMVAYGVNSFYSAFLMRSHGMTLAETGAWLGSLRRVAIPLPTRSSAITSSRTGAPQHRPPPGER